MNVNYLSNKLIEYRFESLFIALLLLVFDKIFFLDNLFFIKYVWPFNMLLISVACYGIFNHRRVPQKYWRYFLLIVATLMPFAFLFLGDNTIFIKFLTCFYIIFYFFIFWEVMRQVIFIKVVEINVVIGSMCGYMLLVMIAVFTFLGIEQFFPQSFEGITYDQTTIIYNEMLYFSFITLTTIGYGDIHPLTDTARLTTAFFGMVGQFYMVALVGIIISKFSAKPATKQQL